MPVDKSCYVTSVWVFMTFKWTMMIWLYSKAGKKFDDQYATLNVN